MTLVGLVFEGLVVFTLIAAGALAWRLDRRLNALRSGQDGLAAVLAELVAVTDRAEASMRALKSTGAETARDLDARTREARALADELRLLVERGGVRPAKPAPAPRSTAAPADPAGPAAKRLMETLKTVR